jgi:hypothetical protein
MSLWGTNWIDFAACAVRPCEQRDQSRNQRPQAQPFVALSAIGLARTNFLVGTSFDEGQVAGIDDSQVCPISDQRGNLLQIDVAAAGSVVESAVCVLLD